MERTMINWTDTDNRMQAHRMTTERANRQASRWHADRSGEPDARSAGAPLEPRPRATFKGAWALCRAAGRRLALPIPRGAQPS
jgi:hypothetical protein